MYFTKTFTAANDASVSHHKIVSVKLSEDDAIFEVLIHSWASSAAREAGYEPLWRQMHQVDVDTPDYSSGFREGLIAYFIAEPSGMLEEATGSVEAPV